MIQAGKWEEPLLYLIRLEFSDVNGVALRTQQSSSVSHRHWRILSGKGHGGTRRAPIRQPYFAQCRMVFQTRQCPRPLSLCFPPENPGPATDPGVIASSDGG